MRFAFSVFAALSLFVGLITVQSKGWAETAEMQPARRFVVECRIVSEEPPAKDRHGRAISQPLDFKTPPLTAREGEKASIADLGQKTVSVARLPQGDVTRTVTSGTALDVIVTGVSNDKAILDITAELSSPQTTPVKYGESVCLTFAKLRVIECVTLGQKAVFRVPSQGWRLEATVKAAQN